MHGKTQLVYGIVWLYHFFGGHCRRIHCLILNPFLRNAMHWSCQQLHSLHWSALFQRLLCGGRGMDCRNDRFQEVHRPLGTWTDTEFVRFKVKWRPHVPSCSNDGCESIKIVSNEPMLPARQEYWNLKSQSEVSVSDSERAPLDSQRVRLEMMVYNTLRYIMNYSFHLHCWALQPGCNEQCLEFFLLGARGNVNFQRCLRAVTGPTSLV